MGEETISALTSCAEFEFFFNTEEFVYWKNTRMRQLDNELGDIHSAIADLESAIIRDVEAKLLKMKHELIVSSITIAEFDCLIAFATSASQFNLVRPTIVDEKVINIKNGRHPLQALCVDLFVPNSTAMGVQNAAQETNCGMVHAITGANFSGKSCYIKQVALIIFMAHIGSFVPADSAVIGKVDRIFTRINSRESCTVPLSTFMIDLQQISFMLENCTRRSLLLIDEFGKGTSTTDGVSLLGATIRHLLARGQECPRTLLATHFFEMFEITNFLPQSDENLKCFNLSLHKDDETRKGEDKGDESADLNSLSSDIVYLRKVVPGIAKKSYGYHCAMRAGIPVEIVERAIRVAEHIKGGTPIDSLQSNAMVCLAQILI
jgi:DNA mismatch repair protein MSH5